MSITHSVLFAFLNSNKSAAEYTNENALPLVLFKELLLEFLISNYRNGIFRKTSSHKKQSLEDRLEETLEKNRKYFKT